MKKVVLIAICLTCSVAQAEMYKCVGKDGKAVYQATKCPTDAKVSTVNPADKVNENEIEAAEARKIEAEFYVKVKLAIQNHQVIPGMTREQAVESIGSPTSINHGQYGGTHDEQWVYHRTKKVGNIMVNNDSYVYFKNGSLTSIQWSQ
jgi:hypothetical protein